MIFAGLLSVVPIADSALAQESCVYDAGTNMLICKKPPERGPGSGTTQSTTDLFDMSIQEQLKVLQPTDRSMTPQKQSQ
ncbi:hypothetical protein [Chachezhania sediminis]|uniref:hypothetical protein n=1 Tax=Chachezhania sediminis TaxID=2599291 RepID=UPI00131C9B06|nr:hypothetical protein [Chachezhania sediminis]